MKLLNNRRFSPKFTNSKPLKSTHEANRSPSESQFIFITTDIDQVQEPEIDDNFVIKRESLIEMHKFT